MTAPWDSVAITIMETETYTKQIGGITYFISSVACSKETEKEVADKLKSIIIDAIKNTEKAPILSGKSVDK